MSSRCDYKRSKTGQHRRQRARHQGLLVLTLILIGLFGGLLAYIRGDRTPSPATAAASPPTDAPTAPAAPALSATPAAPAAPALPTAPGIVAPPASPPPAAAPVAEPAPVKPKYDFYTELPKRQIDVQSGVAPPGASPSHPPVRTQPAVNQLQKPAPPRKNATPATLATASNGKTAKVKPVSAETPAAEPVRSKTVGASSATKPPMPRPLANNGSKIAVKTE